MNTQAHTRTPLLGQLEIENIKQKTNQLKQDLESNNVEEALKSINEINDLNNKNFYDLIGKLTRGLHHAIYDLDVSDSSQTDKNNRARVDLKYVIEVTHQAAAKTLDMTERTMVNVNTLKDRHTAQEQRIDNFISVNQPKEQLVDFLKGMKSDAEVNYKLVDEMGSNVSEIVIAQNYQDISSQSISKVIEIIKEVEGTLITLTQYTNLLRKLNNFGHNADTGALDNLDSAAIQSDIEQLNSMSKQEHLDQDDVDDLLSSLGF